MEENKNFEQEKTQLKEKYKKEFTSLLPSYSKEFYSKIAEVLGEKYLNLKNKIKLLVKTINQEKIEFFNSNEYLKEKTNFDNLKALRENAKDEEYEDLNKKFKESMLNLSTLNNTLNNKLKILRQEVDENNRTLEVLLNNSPEIDKVKEEIAKKVVLNLFNLKKSFNEDLQELCKTYGVEYLEEEAFIIDNKMVNEIVINIDETLEDNNDEKIVFSNNLEENQTLIKCDNDSKIYN